MVVHRSRRNLFAAAAASAAWLWALPAAAQLPTSTGQRLAPQNGSEQHLSDMTVDALNALGRAQGAAAHCDPKGLADAVQQLQQLEQESRRAASTARLSGSMSLVRPEFADSIHNTIAGELQTARGLKPNCPTNQAQPGRTTTPPANPPPPPPPPPPGGGFLQPRVQTGPVDLIDQLEDAADDAVNAYWNAVDHCDRDGMQRALDKLRDIKKQAQELGETARAAAAGGYGRLSRDDIEELEGLEDDIDDFINDATWVIPKCPLFDETRPQTGTGCPTPKPQPQLQLPREALLQRPFKVSLGYTPRLSSTMYAHEMLDYQNSLRADFGSPPLHWNPTLAAHALDYAKTLTDTGQLQHSPRAGRESERENLSLSPHRASSLQRMFDTWGSERRYFQPGIFPNVSINGDWMSVAHYTQIVWPTTTEVGCGFYAGRRFDGLVCRYSPPGNIDGKPLMPLNPCFGVRPNHGRPERGR